MSEAVTEEIRLPGLKCPMPILKAKKALAKMQAGATLAVYSTDPHSLPDLADFCRQTGHELLQSETLEESGEFLTVIRRRAD